MPPRFVRCSGVPGWPGARDRGAWAVATAADQRQNQSCPCLCRPHRPFQGVRSFDIREDGAHDLRHGSSSRYLSGWLASDFGGTVNRPPRRSIVRTQRVASNPPNKPCHKVDVTNSICNCIGVYSIEFSEDAVEDLVAVRAFDQGRILEAIEKRLGDRPTVETRHRKMLWGLTPAFEAVPPIWELRVGEYRVFYDVDEREKKVYVRAIRRKPPHRTTEEIL